MSTSLLYLGFGPVGYYYNTTKYEKGKIIFSLETDVLRCSQCQSTNITRRGTETMPIGKKQVLLHIPIHRLECNECGCLNHKKISFADPKKTYTKVFKRYVLELSKLMTIKHVAQHLGLSWDTVKEIQKEYLNKHFRKLKLKRLQFWAIDELSCR